MWIEDGSGPIYRWLFSEAPPRRTVRRHRRDAHSSGTESLTQACGHVPAM
jgi:hypothetical protein